MATTPTRRWDPADHFDTDGDLVAYLESAFEDGDSALIAAALGDVARARGMSKVAADAGLGRESLYKALSPNGNPEFATVLKVMQALGLRLHASAVSVAPAVGTTLDGLLDSDGMLAEAETVAVKRVIAWQIDQAMAAERLGKAEMARRMNTSRAALDRLLDPDNVSVTLRTLHKAAAALDKRLQIGLVDTGG